MKKTLLLIIIATLTACSSTPEKAIAVKIGDEYYQTDQAASFELTKNNDTSKIVCESHRKTGSHLKTKSCTTKAQKELERKQAREAVRDNSIFINKEATPPYNEGG